MKYVKSYQTKDGRLFGDRVEAENHELMLNIRGFLHTAGRSGSLSSTDVATLIVANQNDIYTLIGKYRKTMAGVKSNMVG